MVGLVPPPKGSPRSLDIHLGSQSFSSDFTKTYLNDWQLHFPPDRLCSEAGNNTDCRVTFAL